MKIMQRLRGLVWVATCVLVGCTFTPPRPVDRYRDAEICAMEMAARYEGKTHAELLKLKDEPFSQTFRKNGHRYNVILMVQLDVEHPPEGLQASFTVFDDDKEATFSPIDRTFYVKPGERLHCPASVP